MSNEIVYLNGASTQCCYTECHKHPNIPFMSSNVGLIVLPQGFFTLLKVFFDVGKIQ